MSKLTEKFHFYADTICDACCIAPYAILFHPEISGLARFILPTALAFAFLAPSTAIPIAAGSLCWGIGAYAANKASEKRGFDAYWNITKFNLPVSAVVAWAAAAGVHLYQYTQFQHQEQIHQQVINQRVMQSGHGTITCNFDDGRKIVFEKPNKLGEPIRTMVLSGLNRNDCTAKLINNP